MSLNNKRHQCKCFLHKMAKQQNLVEAARGQFSILVFYPGYYNLKPWVGNLKVGFQEATPEQRGLCKSGQANCCNKEPSTLNMIKKLLVIFKMWQFLVRRLS